MDIKSKASADTALNLWKMIWYYFQSIGISQNEEEKQRSVALY